MSSKRYKKLPENTKNLQANTIDKLLTDIKKTVHQNLMSLLI